MSTANLSSSTILANIITSPQQAFAAIKERPSAWLPLLILIVGYCAVSFAYTMSVDLPWLIDLQLQQANDMTEARRHEAVETALKIPQPVYAAIGVVGAAIVLPLFFAISFLYYSIVSFATGDGVKYKQWFALTVWCALPIVFGLAASLVHVLAGDARFMKQEELNPFSFGNLFGVDMTGATRGQRVVLGLDITLIWSLVLSIIGYQAFTKRTITASAAIVLAPIVVIVGVIAFFALR